jgi:Nucleotidyl transferase AbiEii toxin, Type IV TA system
LHYRSDFNKADALRPHIQIEVSARDTQMTPLLRPVASFVSAASNQPPEVSEIRCIDPVESAADKLSAIAWRIPDRERGGKYDDPSLVRHIHDLALLKDLALAHEQFTDLVMSAMQDDAARPKNNPALAGMPAREKLALLLHILANDKNYPSEYERFVGGVSYAAAEKIPHYAAAIEAISQLVNAVSGAARN